MSPLRLCTSALNKFTTPKTASTNHQNGLQSPYMTPSPSDNPFDAATWAELPSFFERLPTPITLTLWADPAASLAEREAVRLCRTLTDEFAMLHFQLHPRRENYPYYPVIGVFGRVEEAEEIGDWRLESRELESGRVEHTAEVNGVDYGVRLIGLPVGYQMTSLIAAIQVVSFQAQTLEPLTRIKLRQLEQRLEQDLTIEILATAAEEGAAIVAKHAFGFAVACPRIRTFLIMADAFPEAAVRFSARHFPHTIINGRHHISGVVDEAGLLAQVIRATER